MTTPRKHWFRVADSVADENWSNDILATMIRLMAKMNTRWARNGLDPDGACTIRLSRREVMQVTGCGRPDVALTWLERAAHVVTTSVGREADVTVISWPKYAIFQELATRESPSPHPPPQDARRKTQKTPISPIAPMPLRGPTNPPDRLCDEDHNSILLWALKHHPELTEAQIQEAEEVVMDWARSNGHRKKSWLATVRNAIRLGWALKVNGQRVPTQPKPRLTFEEEQGARRKQVAHDLVIEADARARSARDGAAGDGDRGTLPGLQRGHS